MTNQEKQLVVSMFRHEAMQNFMELLERNGIELPLDGDDTEEIAELFLNALNYANGNLSKEEIEILEERFEL
jgi:hypothetical protein